MVRVGLIGLGPDWEDAYRTALERLSSRITVQAVHTPVAVLGRGLADDLGAVWCEGILETVEHRAVDALLVLDGDNFRWNAVRLAASVGKAVFVANPYVGTVDEVRMLSDDARRSGHLLFPALGRRHTPATGRLRELMATHLGRPVTARVYGGLSDDDAETTRSNGEAELRATLDWCRYVFQDTPTRIATESAARYEVKFDDDGRHGVRSATIMEDATGASGRIEVECEFGRAEIRSPHDIGWQINGRMIDEQLGEERPALDVMLDHFCRRVVGGLIPVADFADVCIGLRMQAAAEESRRTRQPVSLVEA